MSNKRKIEEIMDDILPGSSRDLYNKKWEEFKRFVGEKTKTDEGDYLQYFDHLHTGKKFKASTLWSTYSMLNSIHQREFAEKLQVFPRVTQLLKSYNVDYERVVGWSPNV